MVKVEVFSALDDESCNPLGMAGRNEDSDHLEEMQEFLERLDDQECLSLLDDGTVSMRFDLCDTCRQRFLRNPLGIKKAKNLNFSQN